MLKLSPDILRHAYDYLAVTQPFSKWNLPDGDDIKFKVVRSSSCHGWHRSYRRKRHEICISESLVGSTDSLMRVLAHEMIHVYQEHVAMTKGGAEHDAAFTKLAAQVCAAHVWDLKAFL